MLLFIDCFAGCNPRVPLRLSQVPATAAPGAGASVLVETFNGSSPVPRGAGATVSVGGRTFTTGSDGVAQRDVRGERPRLGAGHQDGLGAVGDRADVRHHRW